jgi:hypothetical protein
MNKPTLRKLLILPALAAAFIACNLPLNKTDLTSTEVPAVTPLLTLDLPSLKKPPPILPTVAATAAAPTDTPAPTATATTIQPYTTKVETLFEGAKEYRCDERGCWRTDGKLYGPPEYYFPGVDADNSDVQALLADSGLPVTPVTSEKEKWERTMGVWAWLRRRSLDMTAPGGDPPYEYLKSLSYSLKPPESPTIDDLAKVFARYRVVSWTGCTARALAFVTFLYRFGIGPDETAVAYFRVESPLRQHLYAVLRVEGRWLYVDPTCIELHPALGPSPESVGCAAADYEHPGGLMVLPGSSLAKPMLLQSTTS